MIQNEQFISMKEKMWLAVDLVVRSYILLTNNTLIPSPNFFTM